MNVCTLTESAKNHINLLCEENSVYGISLNLKGGGCAGFEYDWQMVETENDLSQDDEIISAGSGKLVIGASSIMFLIGTEIDYVRSLVGSNFEIKNPNAQSSCGCGVSVNFDFDNIDKNVPHW